MAVRGAGAAGAQADWIIEAEGAQCVVRGPGQTYRLRLMLPGEFNRANAVCAFAMLRTVGVEAVDIIDGFADVVVPGRMERFEGDGVIAFVDYAHTPDALARVLEAAREITPHPGRVLVLFGCGGERDHGYEPPVRHHAEERVVDGGRVGQQHGAIHGHSRHPLGGRHHHRGGQRSLRPAVPLPVSNVHTRPAQP